MFCTRSDAVVWCCFRYSVKISMACWGLVVQCWLKFVSKFFYFYDTLAWCIHLNCYAPFWKIMRHWRGRANNLKFCIGIDFMDLVMMRVAWFCTLLTRSKLDLAVVPHAVMPYSSTGLTLPVYSLLRVTVSAPHVVPANFFMRASCTMALASAFLVCCFQVSRLSKVTPR